MSIRSRTRLLSVLGAWATTGFLITSACAPRPPGSTGSGIVEQERIGASEYLGGAATGETPAGQREGAAAQSSDRTLVVGLAAEVRGFSPLNGLQNKYVEDLIHGNLFLQSEEGQWFPVLAAETPSFDNGTWRRTNDGGAETILKIRRGVKWHDGVEFTVHDLVFWWKVGRDRDIPWEGSTALNGIGGMEPLDDYTLKVTWREWEPRAHSVDHRMMWPVPRHILEDVYTTDKQRFINHPYWSTEYVGLGPYKLVEFVPGSHLQLAANEAYALGPPKIKNVVVRFYQDVNVLIAALLAGDVHMTLHGNRSEGALSLSEGILLGERWNATGEGKVILHASGLSTIAVQMQPEWQRTAGLGDVQVRRALLHAMDRQAIVEKLFSGFTDVAHGWFSPRNPDHAVIADAITHYPYDVSRAQRLLVEAGWQPGVDGVLVNSRGERFELEYRAQGRVEESVATIVADAWKTVGIDAQLLFVPSARARDNEWVAKFPGVRSHNSTAEPGGSLVGRYDCERMPLAANQWVNRDRNAASYCTPEMQRWVDAAYRASPYVALAEIKEMMRIALSELPYLPLYFESDVGGVNRVPPRERGRIGMLSYTWVMQ